MLKPFFTNPFKSLATRIGQPVGKGLERVMLQSVGGGGGIRKAYRTNADGSVTMLSTRSGFPEFNTPQVQAASPSIVVSDADGSIVTPAAHVVTMPAAYGTSRSYAFSLVDVTAVGGVDYQTPLTNSDFSDGVTIGFSTITVPAGVISFTVSVTVINPAANLVTYEVHVGSAVGIGTIIGI